MRSLSTAPLFAPRDPWPRLLSVDIYPPGATYKANAGQTKPFPSAPSACSRFLSPSLQAWRKTVGPSSSMCSLSRMSIAGLGQKIGERSLADFERVAAEIVAVQLDQVARAPHCGALYAYA